MRFHVLCFSAKETGSLVQTISTAKPIGLTKPIQIKSATDIFLEGSKGLFDRLARRSQVKTRSGESESRLFQHGVQSHRESIEFDKNNAKSGIEQHQASATHSICKQIQIRRFSL